MLSKEMSKHSSPALPITAAERSRDSFDESHLSRSPEVENIPQEMRDVPEEEQNHIRPASLHRSVSASSPSCTVLSLTPSSPVSDQLTPPPPPPIYRDDVNVTDTVTSPTVSDTGVSSSEFKSGTMMSVLSGGSTRDDSEDDVKRKHYPADKAYYIAKELLMTERTYKKDLELICVWFRNAISRDDTLPDHLVELLFGQIDPIYEYHVPFLKEVEQRIAMWEGKSNAHLNGDYQKIGDILLANMKVLKLYQTYMEHHEHILTELELALKRSKQFELLYKDFEAQKVCYLPLNTFLLKPAQRLLHYKLILERLLKHYGADHANFKDCQACLSKIIEVMRPFETTMKHLENMQKLIELQRDLTGIESFVQPNRLFIREGCLQKLSRKGYQQRMFFLFSDMLLYTSRTAMPSLQFKVHGQLPLRGMIVEETDASMAVANSFTLYSGNRCLLLAASSQEEKDKWLEDLQTAIVMATDVDAQNQVLYPSLKSNSSTDTLEDGLDEPKADTRNPSSPERQIQHRANTTMHVCWHRNTSVSMRDQNVAVENQLSGYLLRKFKNSNGWQKLWVVFTNFCLFFYKTFQDDFPLASLPLLGYAVTTPTEADAIHKEYVFKLQFKNHVYFFRAESEYTFER
ncbi:hypothetical protein NP493_509g01014 [Ridgeia piscesae]|uniref:Uncharacterized protein n=1 Tax=Ridgeia piscesae TaxID=27915 RepID=A0AAD9NQZ0_RIDPI|nr:hypothetical protein NP493_509g01014 [Ridgeia piscesae]